MFTLSWPAARFKVEVMATFPATSVTVNCATPSPSIATVTTSLAGLGNALPATEFNSVTLTSLSATPIATELGMSDPKPAAYQVPSLSFGAIG